MPTARNRWEGRKEEAIGPIEAMRVSVAGGRIWFIVSVVALESAIVSRIMRKLESTPGVWAIKIHGDNMGRRGVPDIIGSRYGRSFALEVKRPEVGVVSESQKYQMQKLANAGAVVAVVESLEDVMAVLEL